MTCSKNRWIDGFFHLSLELFVVTRGQYRISLPGEEYQTSARKDLRSTSDSIWPAARFVLVVDVRLPEFRGPEAGMAY